MSSGRGVRLVTGANEGGCTVEARDRENTASKWFTSRFTGPSRRSEITFVELLLPRRRSLNSTSRELRPLGT